MTKPRHPPFIGSTASAFETLALGGAPAHGLRPFFGSTDSAFETIALVGALLAHVWTGFSQS